MHYFIYPQKDSYVTTEFAENNFGLDEILELRKIFSGSYSTTAEATSRILTQFDYSDISSSIVNGDIPTSANFYLRMFEAQGNTDMSLEYKLDIKLPKDSELLSIIDIEQETYNPEIYKFKNIL